MLLVTIDNQHSNTPGIGSIMWDRYVAQLRVEQLRGVHVLQRGRN